VVPQSAMDRMLTHADNITVHLPGSGGQSFSANSLEAVPSATAYLPSAALGSMAGGAIPVDARDEQGLRAIERVFQFDVTLPYQNALRFVGRRVYVRFEHGKDALASRIYQRIRRQFLSRLGICSDTGPAVSISLFPFDTWIDSVCHSRKVQVLVGNHLRLLRKSVKRPIFKSGT